MKLRPMSEAPLNKWMIVQHKDGHYDTFLMQSRADFLDGWVGFYELPDLLRAAAIVDEITPEGYEYDEVGSHGASADGSVIFTAVFFRRIAPPVEYRYEAEDSKRVPTHDDFVWSGVRWIDYETWLRECVRPYKLDQDTATALCARRVEVKR